MIVEYSRENGLRLLDADDFKRFKVTLMGFDRPPPNPGNGLEIHGADALVPIDLVPALPGSPISTP